MNDVKPSVSRGTSLRTRAFLASIVESSDDAIIGKDLSGIILTWNPGAERLYGYAAEEIIGRSICVLCPPGHSAETLAILERVGRGEKVHHYETERIRKDGRRVQVSLTISPVRDTRGRIQAASTIARDITERKQAEKELRLAGAYNRRLIEASLDPLVTIAPNGVITDANHATEEITGRSRVELIGTDFCRYFTDPGNASQAYERAFRDGSVRDHELAIRRSDGRTTPVLYNASVYRDEEANVVGVFAAARDITVRKRAEAQVRELNAALERRVAERTAELVAVNKELETFSYSVSHDLRTPLRAIGGFCQVLIEDYAEKLDFDGKDLLLRMRAASQRTDAMILGLLELSRTTRSEIRRTTVDMSALARTVALELRQTDPEREAVLEIAPDLVVAADPDLLRIVLQNLLGNAWKFTSRHPRARIEVGSVRHEGQTAYFVRDDGAGFDMAYAGKLFGAFQRLHTPSEFEGTGIGLANVQRIVHRHGGRIWAEGEVEKGASFFFTMPEQPEVGDE